MVCSFFHLLRVWVMFVMYRSLSVHLLERATYSVNRVLFVLCLFCYIGRFLFWFLGGNLALIPCLHFTYRFKLSDSEWHQPLPVPGSLISRNIYAVSNVLFQIFARIGAFVGVYSISGLLTSTLTVYVNSQVSFLESTLAPCSFASYIVRHF